MFTEPIGARLSGIGSCHTWGVAPRDEADLAVRVARELAECRQRGIERLDAHTHNQAPVAAPELQRLAAEYAEARHAPARGRIAQIKMLLLAALAELNGTDATDATLIRDLFFGEDAARVRERATDLLKRAQRNYGEPGEARFREIRNAALRNFADVLIDFVEAARLSASAVSVPPPRGDISVLDAPVSPDAGIVWGRPLEAILQFSLDDPGGSGNLTIEEHQKIIDQYGQCWWGWFKAAHESDQSAALAQRLRDCEVGLWDRSEEQFFVAYCERAVTAGGAPVESPDRNLTPAYYRSSQWPAWLGFRSIRRSSAEEFEQRFGDFPNAPATVYFSPEGRPEPVRVQATGRSVLHLADLRFGRNHRWSTAGAPRRSFYTTEQAIAQALLVHGADLASIGVVVICGNFACDEPSEEAFGDALAFIDGLCEEFPNIERQHVVVIPGSDDFARPGDRERLGQSLYREFHQDLYGATEEDLTRMRAYELEGLRLNVLPVNSVKMLGENERDEGMFGNGYDIKLNVMRDDYLRHRGPGLLVNAVAAHHHLISTPVKLPEGATPEPVRSRVMPGMHDAREVLLKLSASRVSLFLHGHLHEADCYTVTSDDGWQTVVCSAGTAGAAEGWLRSRYRENHRNHLALYDVEDESISGKMFSFDEDFRRSSPAREFSIAVADQQRPASRS
jgi:hypothetical protein